MLSAVRSSSRAFVALVLALALAAACAAPGASLAAPHSSSHPTHAKTKHHKPAKPHHKKKKKKKKKRKKRPSSTTRTTPAARPPTTTTSPPAPPSGAGAVVSPVGGSAPQGPPVVEPPVQPPVQPPVDPSSGGVQRPLWEGGFETGNFSQWRQLNGNVSDTARYFGLVGDPVTEGRWAFRSTVDAGATQSGEAGQRSMVLLFPSNVPEQNTTGAYEGSERWYRSRFYFPGDFDPSPNSAWNWLVQWHNWPDGICCANLAIAVDATGGSQKLSMRVMGGGDAAHPAENNDLITERNPAGYLQWFVGDPTLKRNHWYDSVTHVKWSSDPTKGYVEWWLDGRLIMSRAAPTLYWYADNNRNYPGATPGSGQAYYMEGYYRPANLPNGAVDTSTESVYFDGARIGTSAASVTG
jgi:polysaccharide lyase-like protein